MDRLNLIKLAHKKQIRRAGIRLFNSYKGSLGAYPRTPEERILHNAELRIFLKYFMQEISLQRNGKLGLTPVCVRLCQKAMSDCADAIKRRNYG